MDFATFVIVKKLQNALSQIWRVLYFTYFGLLFILFFPFFWIGLQFEKNGRFPITFFFFRIIIRLITWGSLLPKVTFSGKKYDKAKPYIICSNHVSYFDIITMYFAYTPYVHFMGKVELLKVPLFGHLFRKMNIPVDRKNKIAAAKSLARASKDLQRGISISIFPEGTITKHTPKMSKFKSGAFKMAIDNQIPILPVTFVNNYHLFPEKIKNGWAGRPGVAKIIVHDAIETVGMNSDTDMVTLSDKTFAVIENSLKKEIKNYDLL